MSTSIVEKLDELLKDDKNFDTRAGLRFMTELVRDAFKVIEKAEQHIGLYEASQNKIESRLRHVETELEGFLQNRADEKKQDREERTRWRWAIIAPSLTLLLSEIFRWFSNR